MEMTGTPGNTSTPQQKGVVSMFKAKPGKLIQVQVKKGPLPHTSYNLLFARWIQFQVQHSATTDVGSRCCV